MMSLLDLVGIGVAYAAPETAGQAQPGALAGLTSTLPMLIGFGFIFYFLIIRPQSKRAKEHRDLLAGVSQGDEVVTAGGLLGTVFKVSEDIVVIQIAENVNINIKKSAIAAILPKGTIETAPSK